MSVRSLNKVQLIGNLTRDPELRYTPSGTAVCSFGLATNRAWTTESGEKKEEAEFHRILSWNKLAELCSQLLAKGRKVYVEGRLQTRTWQAADGNQRTTTEIVISDMIILDSRRSFDERQAARVQSAPVAAPAPAPVATSIDDTTVTDDTAAATDDQAVVEEEKKEKNETKAKKETNAKKSTTSKKSEQKEAEKPTEKPSEEQVNEEINPDDIPF